MRFVYKLDNLLRSIRVSDENSSVKPAIQYFNNLVQLWTFFVLRCTIQIHVINFQPFLTSFAIFDVFTDLFSELNRRESEKQYKMNSEKVETWQGIIISPAQHVQKSRQGCGKKSMHFMYKLDNLLGSIRVSEENSSVTLAIQYFNNLVQLRTFLAFRCTIQIHIINFQHFLT